MLGSFWINNFQATLTFDTYDLENLKVFWKLSLGLGRYFAVEISFIV